MDIDVFLDDLFDEAPTQPHNERPSTSGTMYDEQMDITGNHTTDEYEWSAIQMQPERIEEHSLTLQEYPAQEKECIPLKLETYESMAKVRRDYMAVSTHVGQVQDEQSKLVHHATNARDRVAMSTLSRMGMVFFASPSAPGKGDLEPHQPRWYMKYAFNVLRHRRFYAVIMPYIFPTVLRLCLHTYNLHLSFAERIQRFIDDNMQHMLRIEPTAERTLTKKRLGRPLGPYYALCVQRELLRRAVQVESREEFLELVGLSEELHSRPEFRPLHVPHQSIIVHVRGYRAVTKWLVWRCVAHFAERDEHDNANVKQGAEEILQLLLDGTLWLRNADAYIFLVIALDVAHELDLMDQGTHVAEVLDTYVQHAMHWYLLHNARAAAAAVGIQYNLDTIVDKYRLNIDALSKLHPADPLILPIIERSLRLNETLAEVLMRRSAGKHKWLSKYSDTLSKSDANLLVQHAQPLFDFVEFAGNECNEKAWSLLANICEADAALCREMYRSVYLPRRDYFWTMVKACVCSGSKRLEKNCRVKQEKRAFKEYRRRLWIVYEKD